MKKTSAVAYLLYWIMILCSTATPLPAARMAGSATDVSMSSRQNIDARRGKRSTIADIRLNGSRRTNLQELMRKYVLISLLQNVKGKRSGTDQYLPKKSDGTVDYQHIADVLRSKEGEKNPWYIVDMKRDVTAMEEDMSPDFIYDEIPDDLASLDRDEAHSAVIKLINEIQSDQKSLGRRNVAGNGRTSIEISPRLLGAFKAIMRENMKDSQHGDEFKKAEIAVDGENGNSKPNFLDLLA